MYSSVNRFTLISHIMLLLPHYLILVCLCLFIFSSIYLFYKPFMLYYKIEELKMLFVELNIRLQE